MTAAAGEPQTLAVRTAPALKKAGFRVRGRTFNRVTPDGLTQVINVQLGPSAPPGTTYTPGLRENTYGLFTVTLGVSVPEVAAVHGGPARSWVQEYYCTIRTRLGPASGSAQDYWWNAGDPSAALTEVQALLMGHGLPFLERFASRDLVLQELDGHGENLEYCAVPRIVSAVILFNRGNIAAARMLMSAQTGENRHNKNHPAYVRELALRMGLGAV